MNSCVVENRVKESEVFWHLLIRFYVKTSCPLHIVASLQSETRAKTVERKNKTSQRIADSACSQRRRTLAVV